MGKLVTVKTKNPVSILGTAVTGFLLFTLPPKNKTLNIIQPLCLHNKTRFLCIECITRRFILARKALRAQKLDNAAVNRV